MNMKDMKNECLEAAIGMAQRGFQCVPIDPEKKHPPFKWRHLNETGEIPDEETLRGWWSRTSSELGVGIITGKTSGYVVVDCDNPQALELANRLGFTETPVRTKTKHGWHFWWKWPEGEDYIAGQVGANANGVKWPSFKGLDFRATGNIAVIPPTRNYEWEFEGYATFLDAPEWKGYNPRLMNQASAQIYDINNFRPENILLPEKVSNTSGGMWNAALEKASQYASGKLPSGGGNGRNDMLYRYLGERCASGVNNRDDLFKAALEFQTEFFEEPFPDQETWASVDRLIEQDKRAHPERYETKAELPKSDEVDAQSFKPITTSDLDRLKSEIGSQEFYIEPFLPTSGTIMQVFGYSGHGKSMFIRHALYMAASRNNRCGPFDIPHTPRVLYFDFENSRTNVYKFLDRSARSFGDAKENFSIWAPFDNDDQINLSEEKGKRLFFQWVVANKADIVVIDTIRSAFPGINENSAEDWSKVNELALKLRNNGITCIFVHHSNKPGEHSLGREAGSTNQLTVLETQLRVTQVYRDQDQAQQNAGIWDGDLEHSMYERLSMFNAISADERIDLILQLRYGKVREWTDMHEPVSYVAFVSNSIDKTVRVHSLKSPKQRARELCRPYQDLSGVLQPPMPDTEIARRLDKPLSTIKEWTQFLREYTDYRNVNS